MSVVARWRARLATRKALLAAARGRAAYWRARKRKAKLGSAAYSRAGHYLALREALVATRALQVVEAKRVIERHKNPQIRELGATVEDKFGPLGEVVGYVGHYTAGPRDRDDNHAIELWQRYHSQHKLQGWGGIGYHFGITRKGTIVLLRRVALKGAHTAGANTGRIGIVCHGAPGDKPTAAQAESLRWLIGNAHTSAVPESHRVDLQGVTHGVHKDFTPTACPGDFERMYRTGGSAR